LVGASSSRLGNHAWDREEIVPYIEEEPRLIRPLNYVPGTPGRGATAVPVAGGRRVLVVQAMWRLFMEPLDDPFHAVQAELAKKTLGAQGSVQAVVVDIHAEATSEKQAMGHSFDGRASLVIGTHTHVPSADHRVLPGGTAFQSDAGMCGDYDSMIGMQKGGASLRFWRRYRAKSWPRLKVPRRSAGCSSRPMTRRA